MKLLVNRYNSQKRINTLQPWGSKMSLDKRWQVSFRDSDNNHYDYYFATKPTRKQIRNCLRTSYENKHSFVFC